MIQDTRVDLPIISRETVLPGRVVDVRRDVFDFNGTEVVREYVVHPGAVGIVAINENAELLLVEQYRHPVGSYMWEPPAGLLDAADEDPLDAAKRELLEETGYEAARWNVLFDIANSPGGSSEQLRCYLAQGLTEHQDGRPVGSEEELNMPIKFVPVDEVLASIVAGQVTNPLLVAGTFALLTALAEPDLILRKSDSEWRARADVLQGLRVRLPR